MGTTQSALNRQDSLATIMYGTDWDSNANDGILPEQIPKYDESRFYSFKCNECRKPYLSTAFDVFRNKECYLCNKKQPKKVYMLSDGEIFIMLKCMLPGLQYVDDEFAHSYKYILPDEKIMFSFDDKNLYSDYYQSRHLEEQRNKVKTESLRVANLGYSSIRMEDYEAKYNQHNWDKLVVDAARKIISIGTVQIVIIANGDTQHLQFTGDGSEPVECVDEPVAESVTLSGDDILYVIRYLHPSVKGFDYENWSTDENELEYDYILEDLKIVIIFNILDANGNGDNYANKQSTKAIGKLYSVIKLSWLDAHNDRNNWLDHLNNAIEYITFSSTASIISVADDTWRREY
jgi:hypothetical protein